MVLGSFLYRALFQRASILMLSKVIGALLFAWAFDQGADALYQARTGNLWVLANARGAAIRSHRKSVFSGLSGPALYDHLNRGKLWDHIKHKN
ncbi:hypothetical protein XELAEV_18007412mg [Xenopus laevis]|uniref:Uncharacterized protein n=1 Tax=Xenopus laevis TaxID=8355 RepID=A0A974E0L5_XENLA|nr:hypothetical protein XELAEV_18007412mg [Xenopus laevis]